MSCNTGMADMLHPNMRYVSNFSYKNDKCYTGSWSDDDIFLLCFFLLGFAILIILIILTESYTAKNSMGKLIIVPMFFISLGLWIEFHVLDCNLGCSSWASAATSISYICANIWREGFAFLMSMLVFIAWVIHNRVDKVVEARKVRSAAEEDQVPVLASTWSRPCSCRPCSCWINRDECGEMMVRIGFSLTTITGFLPARASNCGIQPKTWLNESLYEPEYCPEAFMSDMHGYAIVAGVVMSSVGVLTRLANPLRLTIRHPITPDKLRLLAAVILCSFCFLLALGFAVGWITRYYQEKGSDAIDICIAYRDVMSCTGASLPAAQLQWAENRTENRTGWVCRWNNDASFHLSPCTHFDCNANGRLSTNREGILMEYFGTLHIHNGTFLCLPHLLVS